MITAPQSLNHMNRLIAIASRPVDGASAAAFRVIFGLFGLVVVIRFFANDWIVRLYIEPTYHFSYLGFGWLQPWPAWGMHAHLAMLGMLSVAIAIGYRYRLCTILFFLGFTYVELIDRTTYLNHYYLMSLVSLLMIFLPLHRTASVDGRFRRAPRHNTVPCWTLWTLRAQVGLVYMFAGIAKLNPDWLYHALPLRIWLYQSGDLPVLGPLLQEVWVAYVLSWSGAFFDLTIVAWLMWSRARPWAYLVLVSFHLMTALLFPQLGIFPWLMIGSSLIFFHPDWPRCLLAAIHPRYARHDGAMANAAASSFPPSGADNIKARAAVVALGLFALVQLLMPLRHFVYPGNVRWNEAGYSFAWRVMLTEKTGFVQYHVRDRNSGRAWLVSPHEYLTPLQVERMAIQPDLILQTAHIIAADFRTQGYSNVTITADAFVAFNGRAYARLIDPSANLANIAPSLAPKQWVLPFVPDAQAAQHQP